MSCGAVSDHGEVCVEDGEHWMHATAPDNAGMVTAWGLQPDSYIERPCLGNCGLIVGCAPDKPVTIVHNADGSHLIVDADGTEHSVQIRVEQPRHLHAVTAEEAEMAQQQAPELVDYELDPHYHVTTTVNGVVVGRPEQAIPDPFARTSVRISRWDLAKALLTRKPLNVVVDIGGDWHAIKHVMTVRPIQVVPDPGSVAATPYAKRPAD